MVSNVMQGIGSRFASGLMAGALALGLGSAAYAQPSVTIEDAEGAAGSTVNFTVSYAEGGSGGTGLTIDIGFNDNPIDIAACTFDARITDPPLGKESSAFALRPGTALRAGIVSFRAAFNTIVITDGALFTCGFPIPAGTAEGTEFDFTIDAASYIVPDGTETAITSTTNGVVRVGPAVTNTPVASPTPTPPEASPTNTATNTRAGGGGGGDDDGCQVVAPVQANAAWLLLIPAVLLWQRRRAR